MKLVKLLMIVLMFLVGVYGASAGWIASTAFEKTSVPGKVTNSPAYEYKGIKFRDEESLNQFLREERWGNWCPWVFGIPREILPLLAATAFGFLGGTVRCIYLVSRPRQQPSFTTLLTALPLGMAIGLLLFMLSWLLPKLFLSGSHAAKPETITLAAFSLFGGTFSDEAYNWIQSRVTKLFPKKSE